MPATVKCVISLPDPLEPLVMGIHTIDAQTADVSTEGASITMTRINVIVEDGYIIHVILYGGAGYDLSMNVFADDIKQNRKIIKPDFRPSSNAYEFLYERN